MSKIFDWKDSIKKEEIEEVINFLQNDGIVIFPTDTVYGIGCDCFSEKAIKKIFEIKNRNKQKAISVLTDDIEKIYYVANINEKEKKIIEKNMPGALTLVVNKKEKVPDILTANLDTIGVRIPNNEIALNILKVYKKPIATTSVNISGDDDGTEVKDFIEEFKNKVDIIVDGGKCNVAIPSTVVKLENGGNLKVLRQGKLKKEDIKQ